MKATRIGGVLAVALLALALFFGLRGGDVDEVAVPEDALLPSEGEIIVEEAVVVPDVVETAPEVVAAEPEAEGATEPRSSTAVFDIVRVEPDGETVIAGRAAGNSTLTLLLDGDKVGTLEADGSGNFVALLSLGASDVPRVLTLLEVFSDGGQAFADQSVILAPSPEVLVAEAEDAVEAVEETVAAVEEAAEGVVDVVEDAAEAVTEAAEAVAVAGAPEVSETPATAPVAAEEAAAAAPTILLADSEGVRVIQSGGSGPQVVDNVSIDAINYDSAGEVALTGRSSGPGSVRVYLDNQPGSSGPGWGGRPMAR